MCIRLSLATGGAVAATESSQASSGLGITSVPPAGEPRSAHPWWRRGRRFVDETLALMPFCDRPETPATLFAGRSKADTHGHFFECPPPRGLTAVGCRPIRPLEGRRSQPTELAAASTGRPSLWAALPRRAELRALELK